MMRTCAALAVAGLGIGLLVPSLSGQGPAPNEPAFDVASVRPQAPGGTRAVPGVLRPGGQWVASNVPLIQIIRAAYPEYSGQGRIVGGPSWVHDDPFEIDARAANDTPRDRIRLMVRRLLADRFALATHEESRPFDVYVLLLARSDGRLGPGLRPPAVDCAVVRASTVRGDSPSPAVVQACAQRSESGPNGTIRFRAPGFAIDGGLTTLIGGSVDRPIVDRTGLTGVFDIELEYLPQRGTAPAAGADAGAGVSLFTALQEQLGLRLEPRREELGVLVIDRVQRPTPN